MGAIAGLWCADGRTGTPLLERMLGALHPYGPDAAGRWTQDAIALGQCTMHLFPGDTINTQPLIGGGGRFVMVADVRLDNRDDLALTLRPGNSPARLASDPELVLRAFERWGEACLDHLYGDYAIALWDRERRRWFLARDGLGGRPLCYFRDHRLFAFASMPCGLHSLPEIPYEADEDLLAHALDLLIPGPNATCFRNIFRVGIGECMTVTADGLTMRRHWNPSPDTLRLPRASDYEEALRAEIDRAVRVRLPEMGNVAAQLSSGLDSGTVTATAARQLAADGRRIVAFTAVPRAEAKANGPPGRLLDEGPLAAKIAALYDNLEHVRVRTDGRSPLDALGWVFELCEQPILNMCNQVWRDAIFESSQRRGLKVLLTGQAGNFTLSYKASASLRARLRGLGAAGLLDEMASFARTPRGGLRGVMHSLTARARKLRPQAPQSFANPRHRAALDARGQAQRAVHIPDSRHERLAAFQRIDLAFYTKGALAKWRIDERDPTADRRLVEFCLAVPDAQFRLGGVSASLARRAMTDRLPREVLVAGPRGLQAADWHLGFADPKRELSDVLAKFAICPESAGLLDLARMQRAIECWPTSSWHEPNVDRTYRYDLLRAVSNGDFLQRAVKAGAVRQED